MIDVVIIDHGMVDHTEVRRQLSPHGFYKALSDAPGLNQAVRTVTVMEARTGLTGQFRDTEISEQDVWVLDFEADGPGAGDYDGWQSVYACKSGAIKKLIELYAHHGIDYAELSGDRADIVVGHNRANNGSEAVDLLLEDGTKISVGVHRMPIERDVA